MYLRILIILFLPYFFGCQELHNNTKSDMESNNPSVDSEILIEKDEIFSLLAYSVVFNYWQNDDRNGRGYNVGCILVNDKDEVLDYGINHVNTLENCTQHGEIRLMTSYLNKDGVYALNNHSIYSTLEPCAMCAGMMTMASIKRVVNGQNDYYFTKALERLSFDSESIGGYPPYPRTVKSDLTPSKYGNELDLEYKKYIDQGNKAIITKFLSTEQAYKIYEKANNTFLNYRVNNEVNRTLYKNALDFYNNLSKSPK